jgi:hypothetical protein
MIDTGVQKALAHLQQLVPSSRVETQRALGEAMAETDQARAEATLTSFYDYASYDDPPTHTLYDQHVGEGLVQTRRALQSVSRAITARYGDEPETRDVLETVVASMPAKHVDLLQTIYDAWKSSPGELEVVHSLTHTLGMTSQDAAKLIEIFRDLGKAGDEAHQAALDAQTHEFAVTANDMAAGFIEGAIEAMQTGTVNDEYLELVESALTTFLKPPPGSTRATAAFMFQLLDDPDSKAARQVVLGMHSLLNALRQSIAA